MRRKLEEKEGVRDTFTGIFERFGLKSGYKGPLETVLLTNIKDKKGNPICDHLWFNKTKGFSSVEGLKEGDVLEFDARSVLYEKGYKGYREDVYCPIEYDYKLSHPSKIHKINQLDSAI